MDHDHDYGKSRNDEDTKSFSLSDHGNDSAETAVFKAATDVFASGTPYHDGLALHAALPPCQRPYLVMALYRILSAFSNSAPVPVLSAATTTSAATVAARNTEEEEETQQQEEE